MVLLKDLNIAKKRNGDENSKEIIAVLEKVENKMKIKDKVKIQYTNLCENFWDRNIFKQPIINPTKVNAPR